MSRIEWERLNKKIILVHEEQPAALSSAAGFFICFGSRHESRKLHGATHLLEHLFFKGTSEHNAEELSELIEHVGGEINAYTDRDYTSFYTHVPWRSTSLALEVLTKIIFDSTFEKDAFMSEREVVIQELKGYLDSPDEEFGDSFLEKVWGESSSLGRRIGGTPQSVKSIKHEELLKFIQSEFLSAPIIVSVVSPFSFAKVKKMLKSHLKNAEKYLWAKEIFKQRKPPFQKEAHLGAQAVERSYVKKFSGEQIQLAAMWEAPPIQRRSFLSWSALANHLGAGSSSLLFKEVRERRGLTYTVYSHMLPYMKASLLVTYFSCERAKFFETLEVCAKVTKDLSKGIDHKQLKIIKDIFEGSTYLAFEGITKRMESLAQQVFYWGRPWSLKENIEEVRGLSLGEVNREAKSLSRLPCFFALGDLKGQRDLDRMIQTWRNA